MQFKLPEKLLLGVSTAATQIEGGDTDSNWNHWYKEGHIKDGTNPATGNDHWIKWREDTELLSKLGVQIYRLGIEWSRICPEPDRIDFDAVSQYRQELELIISKGIRPLLTIHHFSNPMWFEKLGGFRNRDNVKYYLDLVKLTVEQFGDIVSDYITINEPNVYATSSFCFGQWYPATGSYRDTFRVLENMAVCHIRAYGMIHEMREKMGYTDTMVGFANHVRVFDPKNPKNPIHCISAKIAEWAFQGAITRAMSIGSFRMPLKNWAHLPKGEYSDFTGVNYYTRSTISGMQDGVRENSPRNDLDWEIYADGIVRTSKNLLKVLNRPIWVTENGTCDANDSFRSRYLYDHLKAISESGLPFERYYHWCFCDNFEWIEGNSAKFGLVAVDSETKERKIKRSGEFYTAIIREHGVSNELFDEYVAKGEYNIR